MDFDLVLKILNILVLTIFGFFTYKYFPLVKNISTWMKDVSTVSKNTQEVLSRLYDPKEIEKIVNSKVELFKNEQVIEAVKTNEEYEDNLKRINNFFLDTFKKDILSIVIIIRNMAIHMNIEDALKVKNNLLEELDETYHVFINMGFSGIIANKLDDLLIRLGQRESKKND